MRLSSVVPDVREMLRGMSIASDTQDEIISADDYLQPHNYVDDTRYRRTFNPLRRVSTTSARENVCKNSTNVKSHVFGF